MLYTKSDVLFLYSASLLKNLPLILKLFMQHWELEFYKVCKNDDPGLTLTYFTARSYWVNG